MVCAKSQTRPQYHWLVKHQKLQARHGPIELLIQIEGEYSERVAAFEQAVAFFDSVLLSLVDELPQLRSPINSVHDSQLCLSQPTSVVSQAMSQAVRPYADNFVTPMAAVAGSVAQCVLAALCHQRTLRRAFVNNGGDIALHLSANTQYNVGICDDLQNASQGAQASIDSASPVRGIATSGWQGRSHSLGIADAVTVMSTCAATADVAATMIANQVNLPGSKKVHTSPATELSPDSDLGSRRVTVAVDRLLLVERQRALLAGERYAQSLLANNLIHSAFLSVQGQRTVVGQHALNSWRDSA